MEEQDVRDILQGLNKHVHADAIEKHIQEFKASKQPKPEWEIVKGWHESIGVHDWEIGEDPGERDCISDKCLPHSVKRLSDGEVFTVGDMIVYEGNRLHVISFEINDGYMEVVFEMKLRGSLHAVSKVAQRPIPVLLTPAQIEKLHQILNTNEL